MMASRIKNALVVWHRSLKLRRAVDKLRGVTGWQAAHNILFSERSTPPKRFPACHIWDIISKYFSKGIV
ncbi:MAG: hypothetical protein IPI30_08195 [Saprospiraceae bacterium]|nr:hypothetical protein [Candidatus Vicinibacter affinis]